MLGMLRSPDAGAAGMLGILVKLARMWIPGVQSLSAWLWARAPCGARARTRAQALVEALFWGGRFLLSLLS